MSSETEELLDELEFAGLRFLVTDDGRLMVLPAAHLTPASAWRLRATETACCAWWRIATTSTPSQYDATLFRRAFRNLPGTPAAVRELYTPVHDRELARNRKPAPRRKP
jgi:hypothetical protein